MRSTPTRSIRWLLLLPVLLIALLGSITPATAAPSNAAPASTVATVDELPRVTIQGTLLNRAENNEPVEGATITVTSSTGDSYEASTDENGRYRIEIPATDEGDLTVALDEDSLPDGVQLAEGAASEREISRENTTTIVSFSPAVGPDNRDVETRLDQIPQAIWNGLLFGIILALASLGLSMVFGTTGLTNFSHGELVTFGALMTYLGNRVWELPIGLAIASAVVLSAAFGWLNDSGLWRPLRRRGTGLIAMMIVSIGLQFFLRNLYQYFTGGRSLTYREYVTPEPHAFGPIDYTYRDLLLILISVLVLICVTLALQFTRLGRATRAVSDNPALAASTGINVNRVISTVWIVGTALAGLAGSFLGFSQSVTFQLGAQVLLLMFAAVCVGGLGSIWGAMVGSVIIGLFIELSTLVIPSELKYAGAMMLLIVVLLVRPQGLLGRTQRIG